QNAIVHGGRLDAGVDLLSKPYTREALSRKIRHVLANQKQRAAAASAKVFPPVTQCPLRILLVEDDDAIRRNTADMLIQLGHQVEQAQDSDQALGMLNDAVPDILLTDIRLPTLSGTELAAKARELHPGIHIVFASGYPD